MPARRKTPPSTPAPDLPFEDAMAELENIVEAMEGEQLPLEELIERYENGAHLLKHCNSVLTSARKRIELITLADRDSADEPEQISRNTPEPDPGDPDDENDITLF